MALNQPHHPSTVSAQGIDADPQFTLLDALQVDGIGKLILFSSRDGQNIILEKILDPSKVPSDPRTAQVLNTLTNSFTTEIARASRNYQELASGRAATEPDLFCVPVPNGACHYFQYSPVTLLDVLKTLKENGRRLSNEDLCSIISFFIGVGMFMEDNLSWHGLVSHSSLIFLGGKIHLINPTFSDTQTEQMTSKVASKIAALGNDWPLQFFHQRKQREAAAAGSPAIADILIYHRQRLEEMIDKCFVTLLGAASLTDDGDFFLKGNTLNPPLITSTLKVLQNEKVVDPEILEVIGHVLMEQRYDSFYKLEARMQENPHLIEKMKNARKINPMTSDNGYVGGDTVVHGAIQHILQSGITSIPGRFSLGGRTSNNVFNGNVGSQGMGGNMRASQISDGNRGSLNPVNGANGVQYPLYRTTEPGLSSSIVNTNYPQELQRQSINGGAAALEYNNTSQLNDSIVRRSNSRNNLILSNHQPSNAEISDRLAGGPSRSRGRRLGGATDASGLQLSTQSGLFQNNIPTMGLSQNSGGIGIPLVNLNTPTSQQWYTNQYQQPSNGQQNNNGYYPQGSPVVQPSSNTQGAKPGSLSLINTQAGLPNNYTIPQEGATKAPSQTEPPTLNPQLKQNILSAIIQKVNENPTSSQAQQNLQTPQLTNEEARVLHELFGSYIPNSNMQNQPINQLINSPQSPQIAYPQQVQGPPSIPTLPPTIPPSNPQQIPYPQQVQGPPSIPILPPTISPSNPQRLPSPPPLQPTPQPSLPKNPTFPAQPPSPQLAPPASDFKPPVNPNPFLPLNQPTTLINNTPIPLELPKQPAAELPPLPLFPQDSTPAKPTQPTNPTPTNNTFPPPPILTNPTNQNLLPPFNPQPSQPSTPQRPFNPDLPFDQLSSPFNVLPPTYPAGQPVPADDPAIKDLINYTQFLEAKVVQLQNEQMRNTIPIAGNLQGSPTVPAPVVQQVPLQQPQQLAPPAQVPLQPNGLAQPGPVQMVPVVVLQPAPTQQQTVIPTGAPQLQAQPPPLPMISTSPVNPNYQPSQTVPTPTTVPMNPQSLDLSASQPVRALSPPVERRAASPFIQVPRRGEQRISPTIPAPITQPAKVYEPVVSPENKRLINSRVTIKRPSVIGHLNSRPSRAAALPSDLDSFKRSAKTYFSKPSTFEEPRVRILSNQDRPMARTRYIEHPYELPTDSRIYEPEVVHTRPSYRQTLSRPTSVNSVKHNTISGPPITAPGIHKHVDNLPLPPTFAGHIEVSNSKSQFNRTLDSPMYESTTYKPRKNISGSRFSDLDSLSTRTLHYSQRQATHLL